MKPYRERKTTRLKGFDYTASGLYFVTICTWDRGYLFGEVIDGKMVLNSSGMIVQSIWENMPQRYKCVGAGLLVVMPNHIHGVVEIRSNNSNRIGLSEIVRGFKSWTARRINKVESSEGAPVWQRSFYDRIIRDEEQLEAVIEYIQMNPIRWAEDEENHNNIGRV